MADIYAGGYRQRRGPGRFIFTILLLGALGGGGFYLLKNRPGKAEEPAAAAPALGVAPSLAPSGAAAPLPLSTALVTPATPVAFNPQAAHHLSAARAAVDAGQLKDAREQLYALLDSSMPAAVEAETMKLLGDVNMRMLLSSTPMECKEYYTIQSGDYLAKIAKQFNTTVALIKQMNGMTSDTIRLGNRLIVFNGEFSLHASKYNHTMDLLLNGRFFKRYIVGTGKDGRTPIAEFTVVSKIVRPPWTRPTDGRKIEFGDPENPLGTRWLAIRSSNRPELSGFGIHGTWERDSVGKQSSNGCIRMLNEEVEELYDIIPYNTRVSITE
jgi:lipoprotein-anchoring transpeptidase ErfK/SrfK